MQNADVIIVGGGIAGLATAYHLVSRSGGAGGRVCLLEQEAYVAAHSSGRNAAIFRPVDELASTAALAPRALALLNALPTPAPVLEPTGLWLVSRERAVVERLRALGATHGIQIETCSDDALSTRQPWLAGGETRHGAWLGDAGVLDIHALHTALVAGARAAGLRFALRAAVRRLCVEAGRVTGVELVDGTRLGAGQVVLAAGAWNGALGQGCGAPLPLEPLRRHLVQLELPAGAVVPPDGPVIWRVEDEVYYRPESGGLLASPCDETGWDPVGEPPVAPAALELLAEKLGRLAPLLSTARVRRVWACLRTFAPDREMVVGADPRVEGLFWLAGLGGRGMSVGLAVAERLACALDGDPTQVPREMRPERLLQTGASVLPYRARRASPPADER